MKHRREIDGLRALAILPVLLFHAGFGAIPGGFLGVDIFFVISGFLITGIIINELHRDGRFSIIGFYERRARRIMPALFLVILVMYPFAWFLLFPDAWSIFCQSLVSITYFASNYFFLGKTGYFDPNIELNPMLHTWSLAIEEQFYLFFPLLLWLLWKAVKERWWIPILAVLGFGSLIWAQFNYSVDPNSNFYLLQFRAWELIAGALAAIHLNHRNKVSYSGQLFSLFGLGMIAYSVFAITSEQPHPGFITLVPVLGTVLVILFAGPGTIANRLLSMKVFVGIGLISYSAYLWHQPIFALFRVSSLHEPRPYEFLPWIALVLLLSWASWKFVENPFRDRRKFNRKKIFVGTVALALVVVALGLFGIDKRVENHRVSIAGKSFKVTEDLVQTNYGLSDECVQFFQANPNCTRGENPDVLLWGDSYAMHLAQGLASSPTKISFVQQTMSACNPVLGVAQQNSKFGFEFGAACIKQNDDVLTWLKTHPNIRYVIMASPWSTAIEADANLLHRDGKIFKAGENGYQALRDTIAEVKKLGVKIIIVLPTPTTGEDLGACAIRAIVNNVSIGECNFELKDSTRAKLTTKMQNANLGAPTFSLAPLICPDGTCLVEQDSVVIYRDPAHLSKAGSALLGKKYDLAALLLKAADNG